MLSRPAPGGVAAVLAAVALATSLPGVARAEICEDFETGFALGQPLRTHPDWFYESSHSGTEPSAGIGVAGSVGLTNGNAGFAWVAHGFTWSDPLVTGYRVRMDFRTDGSGTLNDDRIGWTTSNTDDSSDWQFCVQVEPTSGGPGGAIECYWDGNSQGDNGGRMDIVDLPSLSSNSWYRLGAVFTKLTPTSCRIDVSLTSLDAAGNETGVVAAGTLPDTNALSGSTGEEKPNSSYFTSPMMWPVFKNYLATNGACDNPCIEVLAGGGNTAPDPPTLVAPTNGSGGLGIAPDLWVTATDPDLDPSTATFYGREVEVVVGPPADFTLLVLPDTQHYAESYPSIFFTQTQWIVDHRDSLNLAFVTHEGDIVQNFDVAAEWIVADGALGLLEDPIATQLPDGIPFSVAPGNHDQPTGLYNDYFGSSRYSGRSYYGGHYGSDNDNNFSFFSASGMDFLVINLEMEPSAGAIAWADSLLGAHSGRRAILVSHNLVDQFGAWEGPGQSIYNGVKDNPNLFLMLCGHNTAEAMRADLYLGNTVYTVLANYQNVSNGGNGWLRLMEFQPVQNRIRVVTYSPYLDTYGTDTSMGAYTKSQEFFLPYDMTGSAAAGGSGPFAVIGTAVGIPDGGDAILSWPGLSPGTDYEWYVELDDGTAMTAGPVWAFSTGDASTAVAELPRAGSVLLLGNYPNPWRDGTRIRFALDHTQHIRIRVYDVLGRQVAALADGAWSGGAQEIAWDGRDRLGRPVPAGIYFYRIHGAEISRTGKMTILR